MIFDIETGPQPANLLKKRMPEFDPEAVKCGNLKDQAKIDEKIAAAKKRYEEDYFDKAALSPATGKVLAIGYQSEHFHDKDDDIIVGMGNEEFLLRVFWSRVIVEMDQSCSMIGFNIFAFDLPFLVRRSWILGVGVPAKIIERHRFWNPLFVDLLEVWRLGNRSDYISLDALAQSFGMPGKPDDGTTGKDFGKLWYDNRPKAIEYLRNDLRMTYDVSIAMQIA